MATGDIGGVVTELVITCQTGPLEEDSISAGDAVTLVGSPYTVGRTGIAEAAVFGQALADAQGEGARVPIRVRGVCVFTYEGGAPSVDGASGIAASDASGKVKAPASGNGRGIALKVDTARSAVHVLL